MKRTNPSEITSITRNFPYRLALAGGWIDQPFVSRHNPSPPGSMVVVSLAPQFRFMDRAGFGSSTRKTAARIWKDGLPPGDPGALVRQLYDEENVGLENPSGSQDMIGMIYPGISRLDYDFNVEGGVFPACIESCCNPDIAAWLEQVVFLMPVCQRPAGYDPLGVKNLAPEWIQRLGQSGKTCYEGILHKDVSKLGESLNVCMECWQAILPHTVQHATIQIDLVAILRYYQAHYPGAMYSGCGRLPGHHFRDPCARRFPGKCAIVITLRCLQASPSGNAGKHPHRSTRLIFT